MIRALRLDFTSLVVSPVPSACEYPRPIPNEQTSTKLSLGLFLVGLVPPDESVNRITGSTVIDSEGSVLNPRLLSDQRKWNLIPG